MDTLALLYESLTLAPDDWQARSVLADWYEEAGDQASADAIRWMVRARKRPYGNRAACFWFLASAGAVNTDPESDLPEPVFARLSGEALVPEAARRYGTRRAAEEDCHRAWRAAREGGWGDA